MIAALLCKKEAIFCVLTTNVRLAGPTYVSSELTKDFACSLTEKCKQAANTDNNVYELSPETIDKYQGDSSVKEMLLSVHDRVASSWLSCCV